MSFRFTVFLLVAVGALILLILLSDKSWDAEQRFLQNRQNLLGADAVELDHLAIENRNAGYAVALTRKGQDWHLDEPIQWAANVFAVNRILAQMQSLRPITSFAVDDVARSGQSLADYGLEPAELFLHFGRQDWRATLQIGRVTDIGNRLYVLSPDGQRIHVVNRSLLDSLNVPLEELRSTTVFDIPVFEIRSWNVQQRETGNLRIRMARRGNDWIFETPINARADRDEVETLLQQIHQLRAVRFLENREPELQTFGLVNPLLRLTVEGNTRRESLLVGFPSARTDGRSLYFAKLEDSPTVFTVEIPFLEQLRQAQTSLRERDILRLQHEDLIASIQLTRDETESLLLQRLETGDWEALVADATRGQYTLPVERTMVEALLDQIASLRVLPQGGFVSDAPSAPDLERYQLTVPRWTINLTAQTDGGRQQKPLLQLGARSLEKEGAVFARLAGEPFVYLVNDLILRDLQTTPLHWRERTLENLPGGARIASIQLSRFSSNEASARDELLFAVTQTSGSWEFSEGMLPRENLQQLVGALRNLRAQRFLAYWKDLPDAEREKNQTWTYSLTAIVELEGGGTERTRTLQILLEEYDGSGELRCASPTHDLVFVADLSLTDALLPFLFQRPVPSGESSSGEPFLPIANGIDTAPDDGDLETPPPDSPTAPEV